MSSSGNETKKSSRPRHTAEDRNPRTSCDTAGILPTKLPAIEVTDVVLACVAANGSPQTERGVTSDASDRPLVGVVRGETAEALRNWNFVCVSAHNPERRAMGESTAGETTWVAARIAHPPFLLCFTVLTERIKGELKENFSRNFCRTALWQ